mgnify:CR=1 FL=1
MERIMRSDPATGSLSMRFRFGVVKGGRAVVFTLDTGWRLSPHKSTSPYPLDLGYHSPVPLQREGEVNFRKCDWTGGQCYYDGSGLEAQEVYQLLVTQGLDAMWQRLEDVWHEVFGREE